MALYLPIYDKLVSQLNFPSKGKFPVYSNNN